MRISAGSLVKFFLPTLSGKGVGTASPPTFRPGTPDFRQPMPLYRDHLIDISEYSRFADANTLMELLAQADPDVSAAINAYLTVADVEPQVVIKDTKGNFHEEAYNLWPAMVAALTIPTDLSQGYQAKPSLRTIAEQMRYMALLRGGIGTELVLSENLVPCEIRHVDLHTIKWYEKKPGQMKPQQWPLGGWQPIDLDIPTFFTSHYRGSPLSNYSFSPFASAINTIVARQAVINDLYRIMNLTGYPRIDVTVLEDVLTKTAPAVIKSDPTKLRQWINARIEDVRNGFATVKPDEAFIHTDSMKVGIINEHSSGSSLNVDSIIKVLNAQNQAGLKAMSTILGRGESGVNTSTVEARIFSMNADSLNLPVGEILSKLFSCAYQIFGYPVIVTVTFPTAELRPATELEPMLLIKQGRLLDMLSRGMITDEEFSLQMFGRMPHPKAPKVSGTNFLVKEDKAKQPKPAAPTTQPNPTERDATPAGSKSVDSNSTGGPGSAQGRAAKG
jgi:hypothetical protein